MPKSLSTTPPLATITRRLPLATEVHEQLLRGILRGTFGAGTALPSERALSTQLGVNRNVVREALKRLEHAGLVDIRHGGATRVLDYRRHGGLELLSHVLDESHAPSDDEIVNGRHASPPYTKVLREVIELRGLIAESAARLAAERRRAAHLAALRKHVLYMREAGSQVEVLARNNTDFWRELISSADNFALELTWSSLHRPLVGAAAVPISKRSIDDHERLVDAIDTRDGDGAAGLARRLAHPLPPPSSRLLVASGSTTRKRATRKK